jgi:hypothetical protein
LVESPSGVQEEPTRIAIAASLAMPAVNSSSPVQPIQEQPTRMVSNPLELAPSAPVPFSSNQNNASPTPFSSAPAQAAPIAGLDASNFKAESVPVDAAPESNSKRLLVIGLVMLFTLGGAFSLYWFVLRAKPVATVTQTPKTEAPKKPIETPAVIPVKPDAPKPNTLTPTTPTPIPTTPKPANVEQDFMIKVKAIPAFAKVYQDNKLLGDANDTVTLHGKPGDKAKLTVKDEAGEYKAVTVEVTLGQTTETKMITLEKGPAVEVKKPANTKKPTDTKKPTTPKKPKSGIIDPFKK